MTLVCLRFSFFDHLKISGVAPAAACTDPVGSIQWAMFLQRTVKKRVVVQGVGLHTGEPAQIVFAPAPVDSGIFFVRMDLPGQPSISAHAEHVRATAMATTLGASEFSVSTVEHCLSALAAHRVDNLCIELQGPEIPICDGSAKQFLAALLEAGVVEQDSPRQYAFVTEPIEVLDGDKMARLEPYGGLRVTCTIEFSHPAIGRQVMDLDINEASFEREIASARTFGFLKEVEYLRSKGLARGGSLENAIVLDDSGVMNPGGLRFPNEFVRHKILDALGDLVTLGQPVMGHLTLHKAGHDVMNKLVQRILESPHAVRRVEWGSHPAMLTH